MGGWRVALNVPIKDVEDGDRSRRQKRMLSVLADDGGATKRGLKNEGMGLSRCGPGGSRGRRSGP